MSLFCTTICCTYNQNIVQDLFSLFFLFVFNFSYAFWTFLPFLKICIIIVKKEQHWACFHTVFHIKKRKTCYSIVFSYSHQLNSD